MENDGGFVDLGNAKIAGNANLTTKNFEPITSNKFNHYIHVLGTDDIKGDLNIESSQNIHIGNYDINTGKLLPGSLTVGGDINAHTSAGHITTTIDTKNNVVIINITELFILSPRYYNDTTNFDFLELFFNIL